MAHARPSSAMALSPDQKATNAPVNNIVPPDNFGKFSELLQKHPNDRKVQRLILEEAQNYFQEILKKDTCDDYKIAGDLCVAILDIEKTSYQIKVKFQEHLKLIRKKLENKVAEIENFIKVVSGGIRGEELSADQKQNVALDIKALNMLKLNMTIALAVYNIVIVNCEKKLSPIYRSFQPVVDGLMIVIKKDPKAADECKALLGDFLNNQKKFLPNAVNDEKAKTIKAECIQKTIKFVNNALAQPAMARFALISSHIEVDDPYLVHFEYYTQLLYMRSALLFLAGDENGALRQLAEILDIYSRILQVFSLFPDAFEICRSIVLNYGNHQVLAKLEGIKKSQDDFFKPYDLLREDYLLWVGANKKCPTLDDNLEQSFRYLYSGIMHHDFQRDRLAIFCFNKALTSDPKNILAHYWLAIVYLKQRNFAEVEKILNEEFPKFQETISNFSPDVRSSFENNIQFIRDKLKEEHSYAPPVDSKRDAKNVAPATQAVAKLSKSERLKAKRKKERAQKSSVKSNTEAKEEKADQNAESAAVAPALPPHTHIIKFANRVLFSNRQFSFEPDDGKGEWKEVHAKRNQIQKALKDTAKLYIEGKYEDALAILNALPDTAEVLFEKILGCIRLGRITEASDLIERVEKMRVSNPVLLNLLQYRKAQILFSKKQFDRAIALCIKTEKQLLKIENSENILRVVVQLHARCLRKNNLRKEAIALLTSDLVKPLAKNLNFQRFVTMFKALNDNWSTRVALLDTIEESNNKKIAKAILHLEMKQTEEAKKLLYSINEVNMFRVNHVCQLILEHNLATDADSYRHLEKLLTAKEITMCEARDCKGQPYPQYSHSRTLLANVYAKAGKMEQALSLYQSFTIRHDGLPEQAFTRLAYLKFLFAYRNHPLVAPIYEAASRIDAIAEEFTNISRNPKNDFAPTEKAPSQQAANSEMDEAAAMPVPVTVVLPQAAAPTPVPINVTLLPAVGTAAPTLVTVALPAASVSTPVITTQAANNSASTTVSSTSSTAAIFAGTAGNLSVPPTAAIASSPSTASAGGHPDLKYLPVNETNTDEQDAEKTGAFAAPAAPAPGTVFFAAPSPSQAQPRRSEAKGTREPEVEVPMETLNLKEFTPSSTRDG